MINFVSELELHLKSGFSLIFVFTKEEHRAISVVKQAGVMAGREVVVPRKIGETCSLATLLREVETPDSVIVLDDVRRRLDEPDTIRLLADLARDGSNRTAVIVGPWMEIPEELERISAVLELPLPSARELRMVLKKVCADVSVLQMADDFEALVRVGQGLSVDEAKRAFRKAMIGWPESAVDARMSVARDKRRVLQRSRVLEHVDTPGSLEDVGGLDQLKQWLTSRAAAFSSEARAFGLPAPRGLLLMGIQGCGKSLSAKAVAGSWQLPLVRLELSAVFGQKNPEAALRGALKIAEAMAPVVLWIDEIEKGFEQDEGGTSARLLGGMVTWLQEKKEEVFVVATANKAEGLPPELPRKGRFDEIFFVDLPNPVERKQILELHLKMRNIEYRQMDLSELIRLTDKFTGSELEQLVIGAMYLAFERNAAVQVSDLLRVHKETVPLYETYEAEIKQLRQWARKRARSASTDRRKIDLFNVSTELITE